MFKTKLGDDSPIAKFMHFKIRRRDGLESLTTLEGEFKVPIDGCIQATEADQRPSTNNWLAEFGLQATYWEPLDYVMFLN